MRFGGRQMTEQWFVIRGEKNLGPFTTAKLKELAAAGTLLSDDMVRRADLQFASPAHEIEGLFSAQAVPLPPTIGKRQSDSGPPVGIFQSTLDSPTHLPAAPSPRMRPPRSPSFLSLRGRSATNVLLMILVGLIGLPIFCCGGLALLSIIPGVPNATCPNCKARFYLRDTYGPISQWSKEVKCPKCEMAAPPGVFLDRLNKANQEK